MQWFVYDTYTVVVRSCYLLDLESCQGYSQEKIEIKSSHYIFVINFDRPSNLLLWPLQVE